MAPRRSRYDCLSSLTVLRQAYEAVLGAFYGRQFDIDESAKTWLADVVEFAVLVVTVAEYLGVVRVFSYITLSAEI